MRVDPGVPVCAVGGGRGGSAVLVLDLGASEAARALDAARRGAVPRLTVAAEALVALPSGFDDPLALLAVDLAVAQAALEEIVLPAAPAVVAFAGYGPRAALLHAEVAARAPDIRARVFDRAPLRRAIAAALGADVRRAGPRVPADLLVYGSAEDRLAGPEGPCRVDLDRRPDPSHAQIEAAVGSIAAAPWRYRPLLTSATSALDDEDPADHAVEIAAALLL